MKFKPTVIPDVVMFKPTVFEDERGWLMESFHEGLCTLGLPLPNIVVQDNHSCSNSDVLRTLHYQLPPHQKGKLERISQGAVHDVAVGICEGSPTFGQWLGMGLISRNKHIMYTLEGFSHGFVALENEMHFLYKTTDCYVRECEAAIGCNDIDIVVGLPNIGQLSINT